MPTKQPRTHGADDRLLCPECGGVMTVVEYDHADAFVWQTFECGTCLNRIERRVKKDGDPHRMRLLPATASKSCGYGCSLII